MRISPGKNIAIKVPLHRWAALVQFYRDRNGLAVVRDPADTVAFAFGPVTLWLDRVGGQNRVGLWLEPFADDPDAALARSGGPRRADLEPLDGVTGHWTSDPAGVVLLVRRA